mgnify:CR=1 FL=1
MASLVQRGNRYCVVYQYTNENGERKQKWETYKTASEAKRRKKEIEYKEEVGTFTVPKCKSLDDLLKEYELAIKKRAEHIPLQYIVGETEFMGLKFKVNSNVLIPRQDTETLVEEALKTVKPGMKVLDMCTGSGCIIISILHNVEGVKGYAVDISKQAVNVAKENAKLNEVPVLFERSDLFEMVTEKFDVIVSNPPYIPTDVIPQLMPEVQVFEPIEALDGKEDGLYFYRKIVEQSKDYLNCGGSLMFEIGYDQGKDVSKMMTDAGFSNVCVKKDLAGNDRVATGML